MFWLKYHSLVPRVCKGNADFWCGLTNDITEYNLSFDEFCQQRHNPEQQAWYKGKMEWRLKVSW